MQFLAHNQSIICHLFKTDTASIQAHLALRGIVRDTVGEEVSYTSGAFQPTADRQGQLVFLVGSPEVLRSHYEGSSAPLVCVPLPGENAKGLSVHWQPEDVSWRYDFGTMRLTPPPSGLPHAGSPAFLWRSSRDNFWLGAEFLELYVRQMQGHFSGRIQANTVCMILHFFRSFLRPLLRARGIALPEGRGRSVTLYTVDAEDQHLYYDNAKRRCTSFVGRTDNPHDTRLDHSLPESLTRFRRFGIRPTFMVTGSELREDALDAFGNPLDEPMQNLRMLREYAAGRDLAIGTHGYDHGQWLRYGRSPLPPLGIWAKAGYFFDSGGTPLFLLRYLWAARRYRGRKQAGDLGDSGEFTAGIVRQQLEGLEALYARYGIPFVRFHRHPGFRRSAQVVNCLEQLGYADSSDLLIIERNPVVPVPYTLFKLEQGRLTLSKVKEFPCLFIDRYIRTADARTLQVLCDYLDVVLARQDTVLTIISHTKVTGGDYTHCHVYPRDPFAGLALAPRKENVERIYRLIAERSCCLTAAEFLQAAEAVHDDTVR